MKTQKRADYFLFPFPNLQVLIPLYLPPVTPFALVQNLTLVQSRADICSREVGIQASDHQESIAKKNICLKNLSCICILICLCNQPSTYDSTLKRRTKNGLKAKQQSTRADVSGITTVNQVQKDSPKRSKVVWGQVSSGGVDAHIPYQIAPLSSDYFIPFQLSTNMPEKAVCNNQVLGPCHPIVKSKRSLRFLASANSSSSCFRHLESTSR